MWVDIRTSERFHPLGRFRHGTKTQATHSPTSHNPQPLATMVDENEDLAHRQPVSGRR